MRIRILLALTLWMGCTTVVSAQQATQDRSVQRTASNSAGATSSASTPTPGTPAVIGSIDLDTVFTGYEKVKISSEAVQAKALVKQNELQKMMADMKAAAEKQASLSPTSPEYKKFDQQLTQMKIEAQAFQENFNKEFALIEAEALAEIYRDIQSMTARVAAWRGMNYVVKVSNKPITVDEPNAVMAAMSRTVVYSDPRNDVTQQVVQFLNQEYRKTAGAAARPATNNATPAAAAAQPTTTRGN